MRSGSSKWNSLSIQMTGISTSRNEHEIISWLRYERMKQKKSTGINRSIERPVYISGIYAEKKYSWLTIRWNWLKVNTEKSKKKNARELKGAVTRSLAHAEGQTCATILLATFPHEYTKCYIAFSQAKCRNFGRENRP